MAVLVGASVLLACGVAQGAVLRFDFESGGMDGWRVIEGSFGKLLTDRADFHHGQGPYNKHGDFFLSSLEDKSDKPDDRYTGVVESPVFVLSDASISLLVGGGNHPDTYVALCLLNGEEVRKAQGSSAQKMQRVHWEVPELVGQPLFLRLIDKNTGGWGHVTLDDVKGRGAIDKKATAEHFARAESLLRFAKRRKSLGGRIETVRFDALRATIRDLGATFPEYQPKEETFLRLLNDFEGRLPDIRALLNVDEEESVSQAESEVEALLTLQREALLSNPLVSGQPLLYVVRRQYKSDHHNTATIFQTGEINTGSFEGGGALKTLDVVTGETKTLVEVPRGVCRDPEVHFDGSRIVFSMRKNVEDNYHIYEVGANGTGLRQLTKAAKVSDVDPLYLPGGDIVFSSTREPKYCACNRHIMANLFRMTGDGANVHQIGKSTLFEGHSSLLPDGRILYDRWEYVDRNFGDAQGLWTVNPDGTGQAVYWGNNTWSPGGTIDARPVPGSTLVMAVLGSCHDRPWGALGLIDRRLGLDGRPPVLRTWPASAIDLVEKGDGKSGYGFDVFKRVQPKYEDPYALSEKYFLCSRMTGRDEEMGIYLLDVFGNELLLHEEAPGCFDPMPLKARTAPPAVPPRRDFEDGEGRFYVANVYEGTHMEGVVPGSIKALRVVESPEKRFWVPKAGWGGQGQENPGMNWHNFVNKRILGVVPVEEDGSAYFRVPADRFVFFQLLDENGMMVQSMRSGTVAQSGETTGCVGCHENRRKAPPPVAGETPLAMRRSPDALYGWHGDPRLFSYMAEVQPVFDTHCVECHDFGEEAGENVILAGDRTNTFNTSYNELWRKGFIKPVGAGPAETQKAYSWGSHASKLMKVIREGHEGVELRGEELNRVATWLDLNAPYYAHFSSAYPHGVSGRSPLSPEQIGRLGELTGLNFAHLASHANNKGPQVSFDRPELSPCLRQFRDKKDPKRLEALEIIQAGKEMLAKRPRADMPGFEPWEVDRQRDEIYAQRLEEERENRQAIREGRKRFDQSE